MDAFHFDTDVITPYFPVLIPDGQSSGLLSSKAHEKMASWKPLSISISALIIFSSVAYLLFLSTPFVSIRHHQQQSSLSESRRKHFRAPAVNPFSEIDGHEASEIYTFLQRSSNLSVTTDVVRGGRSANYLVELLRPNKSDVVDFLDHNGPIPERWARVSNIELRQDDAYIVDYMVGPLPPSNDTQILPLIYPHNSGRNYVQSPISDVFALLDWALSIGENASDITQELLGATTNRHDPSDPDALVIGARPALIDHGSMVHWLEFFGSGIESDSRSLLPQGLYVKLDTPTANPSTWTTGEWFYNGILYSNDTVLREAIKSPDFVKLELNRDGSWTDTEDFGASSFPERDMPPPLSIQPYGPRYHLDREQNYVSWMGFSFYLSTAQATALSLFDIRYNSSRLIYQLGLQEALAHYAGVEPMQSGLEFLDTFFGMGSMMFSLVPGVDCPGHAEYIDMSFHKGGKMYTNKNAICVFEYTSDAPLQRHTSTFSATVSRNTYLVVRSVSTVGNYDYTVSIFRRFVLIVSREKVEPFRTSYLLRELLLTSGTDFSLLNRLIIYFILMDPSKSNFELQDTYSVPFMRNHAPTRRPPTRRRATKETTQTQGTNMATACTRPCTRRCTTTWWCSRRISTSAGPPTRSCGLPSSPCGANTTGTDLKSPPARAGTRCTWSTGPSSARRVWTGPRTVGTCFWSRRTPPTSGGRNGRTAFWAVLAWATLHT